MADNDSTVVRTCKKCGADKGHEEFPLRRDGGKEYRMWACKRCTNAEQNRRYAKTDAQVESRALRARNAELLASGVRECKDCHQVLGLDQFRAKAGKIAYRCYGCQAAKMRAKYAANEGGLRDYQNEHARVRRVKYADRLNAEKREYVARNRQKVTDRQNEWAKKKLRSDPMFALKKRIRSLLSNAFASVGSSKNQETQAILGCSFDEFQAHIERQFLPGMSWDRMGHEIHIDHIVPLATATCEQDVVALNHHTNLRPMWAKDNISKGAKVMALL